MLDCFIIGGSLIVWKDSRIFLILNGSPIQLLDIYINLI